MKLTNSIICSFSLLVLPTDNHQLQYERETYPDNNYPYLDSNTNRSELNTSLLDTKAANRMSIWHY